MILPIFTLGSDVLRSPAATVDGDSAEIQQLIDNMIQTMHAASGIGLAAPQIGVSQRIFTVDLTPVIEDLEEDAEIPDQPMVFINPVLSNPDEEESIFEEGCLSIPDIREDVARPVAIEVEYYDRNFEKQSLVADGLLARVVQHEFDHLEGVLFLDYLSPFRKRLLKRRLNDIVEGRIEADYLLAE